MDISLIELAKVLGIPGLIIGCWYLIERAKARRAEKDDGARHEREMKKLELEERKVEAMTAGFHGLHAKIDEHTKVDLAHHAKVGEQLAKLDGKLEGILDERERTPAPQEIPRPHRGHTSPVGVPAVAGEYSVTKPRRG